MPGKSSDLESVREDAPDPASWDAFLSHVPGASPFHLPGWRAALVSTHSGLRDASLWLGDSRAIRAFLPLLVRRRAVFSRVSSQPYGVPGGVWLRDPQDRQAGALLLSAFARRYVRAWNDCVLVDHGDAAATGWIPDAWPGARCLEQETHRLQLPADPEALERLFERRVRKGERRAAALGLELENAGDEAGLAEFMELQHHEAAERQLRFTYPAALLRLGLAGGWLRLHRVRRQEHTLAVTAVAEGCGQWFAWLVAHAPAAREAPTGEFLYAGLLRDAVRRGFRVADFGNSGGREGVKFFKESFGASPVRFRVWRSGPLARARA